MVGLRRAIFSGVFALTMVWPLAQALADQAFQKFLPFLIDLDGWQGKKADGMSMDMTNVSMTTATRDYTKGPAQVHASVTLGQAAAGALAPLTSPIAASPRTKRCRSPKSSTGRQSRPRRRRSRGRFASHPPPHSCNASRMAISTAE
jgi:hypothetical protein